MITLTFDIAPLRGDLPNNPTNPAPLYVSQHTDKKGRHWTVCNLPYRLAWTTPWPANPWQGEVWTGKFTFGTLPAEILEDESETGKAYRIFALSAQGDSPGSVPYWISTTLQVCPRSDRAGGRRSEDATGVRIVPSPVTINPYLPGVIWDFLSANGNRSAAARKMLEAAPDFLSLSTRESASLTTRAVTEFASVAPPHGRPAPPLQIQDGAYNALYVDESHRAKALAWGNGEMSMGIKMIFLHAQKGNLDASPHPQRKARSRAKAPA